jgi:hypothetical protein
MSRGASCETGPLSHSDWLKPSLKSVEAANVGSRKMTPSAQNAVVTTNIWPLVEWLVPFGITILVVACLRRFPKLGFYSLVISALGWGFVLFLSTPPFLNQEFTHSLADAFVIAAFLAATVDEYVKGRVLHDATADLSKYLIGYRLPEQLQDRIRTIMQTRWICRDFEVRIRFRQDEAGADELDVSINERVQNISSETQEYDDSVTFSTYERKRVIGIRCDSENVEDTYHFDELQIQQTEAHGQSRHSGRRIKIPPASDTERDYRFSTRYTAPILSPKEVFVFTQTTIGASIEVTDCPEDMVFHLTPSPDRIAHLRWTYNRLFLPGEQISIQWELQRGAGV